MTREPTVQIGRCVSLLTFLLSYSQSLLIIPRFYRACNIFFYIVSRNALNAIILSQPQTCLNVYLKRWSPQMQEILEQVATHLQTDLHEIKTEPIQHGTLQKHNVCRIRIGTDSYLLKQHEITVPVTESDFTPFQIERWTLSALNNGGYRVPRIIWESEQHHTLLLEWCGDHTLDALAQDSSRSNLMPVLHTILLELCRIESFFAENIAKFRPYVFRFDCKKTMQRLLEQGRKTIGYLEQLSKITLTASQKKHLDAAWTLLATRLLEASPTLDSLDYQARNIVLNNELPSFIDFASIGWDWQERRLVQYFNSIGAHQKGANFVSLLNRELVETYSECVVQHRENATVVNVAARMDSHYLLFYLTVIHRILEAVAKPKAPQNKTLTKAWGNMQSRFQRAISLIIDTDLSDDVHTNLIRDMIGEFYANIS